MYFTPLGNGANSVHITDKQVRRGKKKLAGLLAKARKDPLTGQDARDAIPEIEADRRRPLLVIHASKIFCLLLCRKMNTVNGMSTSS